jgi:hypothetical protein
MPLTSRSFKPSKSQKRSFHFLSAVPASDSPRKQTKIAHTPQIFIDDDLNFVQQDEDEEEEENEDDEDEHDDADDATQMETHTWGTKLHNPSQSAEEFAQSIRVDSPRDLVDQPLSDILDAGDVSAKLFLDKWGILLQVLWFSEVSSLLLELVSYESLVLDDEFKKHQAMLKLLLAHVTDSSFVLQKAIAVARKLRSHSVVHALLDRFCELNPMLARQLEREVKQEPLELSLHMQDQLDCAEDEQLAALEEETDSDDDDFVVDDMDEGAMQDEEYVPTSESDHSDDFSEEQCDSD